MDRLLLALVALLLTAAPASATTFAVNSTADAPDASAGNGVCATAGGACTLRAALQEANGLAGADEVVVPSGTYALGGTALPISASVTVRGSGAKTTIAAAATGNLSIRATAGKKKLAFKLKLAGKASISITRKLPKALRKARKLKLSVAYAGDARHLGATVKKTVKR